MAAALSMALAATVFTISCSGDDGKDGASCTAVPLATGNGLDLQCNGVSKGQLLNGPQGIKGEDGRPGTAEGACRLTAKTLTQVSFDCDGESVIVPIGGSGCDVAVGGTSDPALVVMICGLVEIYMCGGWSFDPTISHCEIVQSAIPPDGTNGWSFNDIAMIVPSMCGEILYDMRTSFCDNSGATDVIRPLCGLGKEKYKGIDNETCVNGNVTKPCGAAIGSTAAPRYIKASEFCMERATNTIATRCGTPNSSGVYPVGKNDISQDVTYTGSYIYGEYNTANDELCEAGKVVKVCGTARYEEKTHFCGVGDVVTVHCTDRQIYDPSTQYCAYMGNSSGNITERPAFGFYNYAPAAAECLSTSGTAYDPTNTKCLKYASTASSYCGGVPTTGPGINNKPNEGSWKWEYCRGDEEPGSIIRCGELQKPPTSGNSTTCECISDAFPISTTANGCRCAVNYEFRSVSNLASGSFGSNNGGQCMPIVSRTCAANKIFINKTTFLNGAADASNCVELGTSSGQCKTANPSIPLEHIKASSYCTELID
jgi:hypothetical protein